MSIEWTDALSPPAQVGVAGVFDRWTRAIFSAGGFKWTGLNAPMSPVNPAHASALTRISRLFDALFDENSAAIRQQCPVALEEGWEPHPDLVVAKPGEWEDAHPRAEDIHLIIEVADSTVREDLARKIPRYARNEVAEVWVVDLTADVVDVHRNPDPAGRYVTEFDAKLDEVISIPAFAGMTIRAARLFSASRAPFGPRST